MSRIVQYYDVWATILSLTSGISNMSFEGIKQNTVPPSGISKNRFAAMVRSVYLENFCKNQDISSWTFCEKPL